MTKNPQNTFKGKKVFLTGHTGFKGAWMLQILQWLGADVKGYSLAPENDFDLYNEIKGDELCYTSVIGDLRDMHKLQGEIVRFEPDYIAINCMKNIVLDMYPEKNEDQSLVIQMVEKGKRLYVLSKLVPAANEFMLIGYTEKQLKDCYKSEPQIWDLFVQNNFIQTIDNNVIKNYVGEGPKTQELGDESPGNIGSFVGWQIVKKYVDKNTETTLDQLMKMNAETIFQEARYKP